MERNPAKPADSADEDARRRAAIGPASPQPSPERPPRRLPLEAGAAWAPERAVDEETFLAALRDTVAALEGAGVFYVLIGGLASTVLGRPRWTWDIDVLVAPEDAQRALKALAAAGFGTEQTDRHWLFKAFRDQVLVDVIFESAGGVHLDDEMRRRARVGEFKGVAVRLAPPEDVVVMKALAHGEEVPRYWHDAIGIIAVCELDWDYLVQRARHGPRRVLSLLAYAQSEDLIVPDWAIRAIFAATYG